VEDEEWRPVVEWEGLYEVSSLGRVRSQGRNVHARKRKDGTPGTPWFKDGRNLKPYPDIRQGYLKVKLQDTGSRIQTVSVHRIVAIAFIPNPEGKPDVLHWDDVKTNNRVENLRWGDDTDNQRDSTRNGSQRNGNWYKESCPKGHPYDDLNTYRNPNTGYRQCRKCMRLRYEERRQRLQAQN